MKYTRLPGGGKTFFQFSGPRPPQREKSTSAHRRMAGIIPPVVATEGAVWVLGPAGGLSPSPLPRGQVNATLAGRSARRFGSAPSPKRSPQFRVRTATSSLSRSWPRGPAGSYSALPCLDNTLEADSSSLSKPLAPPRLMGYNHRCRTGTLLGSNAPHSPSRLAQQALLRWLGVRSLPGGTCW